MGGTKSTAEELERMFSVMEQNGLLRPTRILTGTLMPNRSQRIDRYSQSTQALYLVQKLCPLSHVS